MAFKRGTVCPRSSDLFYTVAYYINWITTSWTYSTFNRQSTMLYQWVRGKEQDKMEPHTKKTHCWY